MRIKSQPINHFRGKLLIRNYSVII
uniref:Uncharacterized protein n=1 Tax=Arundo donax TaxID=35708 RepID=A0A0A8YK28_ARUDO